MVWDLFYSNKNCGTWFDFITIRRVKFSFGFITKKMTWDLNVTKISVTQGLGFITRTVGFMAI